MNEWEKIYELIDSLQRRVKALEKREVKDNRGMSTDKFCTEDAEKVVSAVCQAAEIEVQEFWDSIRCRKNEVTKLRYHCFFILRNMKYTYGCIGATFAGKDHSSVINGIAKISPLTRLDPYHKFIHEEALSILRYNDPNQ